MRIIKKLLPVSLLAVFLTACDGGPDSDTAKETTIDTATDAVAGAEAVKDAAIEWYDGSIEAAFAESAESGKPLFLYWGAVWCPPCQEIKYTVFKSQEFINLTRLFIPVYLDGDTDRAQAWGEKFEVMGYPTMIVFNPEGQEVTRIPGGIDISRYNTVLELSLNQMKPTAELVQLALATPDELSDEDFYQLAYYSWGQDSSAVPEGTDKAAMFYTLSRHAPEGELASRFYADYLVELARANKPDEDGSVELPVQEGDDAYARLQEILESDELTLACWDTLAYYADDLLELPVFTDEQRAALGNTWAEQMFSLRFDDSLSKAEKLGGWLPRLYLLTRDEKDLSPEVQVQLQAEMQQVDQATPDSYERQSVINQMSYIYRQGRMNDAARDLLLAELDKSASPYYFMSGLGSMAEKDENFTEALEWRRRAYETSTGEATRFQWGANYVRSMIRMSPEDEEGITNQAVALLGEFHESNEMFAGRNFRVLRSLNKKLGEWQEARMLEDFAFEAELQKLCNDQVGDSLEQQNCQSLFEIAERGEDAAEKVAQAG